jgi:copper chaperone
MNPSITHPATILVFETNIRFKKDVNKITEVMAPDTRIKKWNVDRSDRSKVLRIEAANIEPSEIIELINKAGYRCAELPE